MTQFEALRGIEHYNNITQRAVFLGFNTSFGSNTVLKNVILSHLESSAESLQEIDCPLPAVLPTGCCASFDEKCTLVINSTFRDVPWSTNLRLRMFWALGWAKAQIHHLICTFWTNPVAVSGDGSNCQATSWMTMAATWSVKMTMWATLRGFKIRWPSELGSGYGTLKRWG